MKREIVVEGEAAENLWKELVNCWGGERAVKLVLGAAQGWVLDEVAVDMGLERKGSTVWAGVVTEHGIVVEVVAEKAGEDRVEAVVTVKRLECEYRPLAKA